jgi:hypothetical protein
MRQKIKSAALTLFFTLIVSSWVTIPPFIHASSSLIRRFTLMVCSPMSRSKIFTIRPLHSHIYTNEERFLMRKLSLFLFACGLALVSVLVSTLSSPVFAASPQKDPDPPSVCLVNAFQAAPSGDGSHEFTVQANVTNTCGATVAVKIRIVAQITDCKPFDTTSTLFQVSLADQQTAVLPTIPYVSGCVDCENGVPIGYPRFHVKVTVLSSGTYQIGGTVVEATSKPPVPDIVELSNIPPYTAIPCPGDTIV